MAEVALYKTTLLIMPLKQRNNILKYPRVFIYNLAILATIRLEHFGNQRYLLEAQYSEK